MLFDVDGPIDTFLVSRWASKYMPAYELHELYACLVKDLLCFIILITLFGHRAYLEILVNYLFLSSSRTKL